MRRLNEGRRCNSPSWRAPAVHHGHRPAVWGDYDPTFRSNNRIGTVTNDDRASWVDAYKLFTGAVAYVWHGNLHVVTVAADLLQAGFDLRSYIVWKKPALVMGRGHYHWQHEPCF
jgi:hypothetical protein